MISSLLTKESAFYYSKEKKRQEVCIKIFRQQGEDKMRMIEGMEEVTASGRRLALRPILLVYVAIYSASIPSF